LGIGKKVPLVTTYTPQSRIRRPFRLVMEMFSDLKNSRELAWRLFRRDLAAQYRQTFLGYFWAVFPPLVTFSVFILLNASRLIQVQDLDVPYPIYVLIGTVFWQIFVDALNAPLKVALENREILTRINLPKESLIISGIGRVLFSLGIKLALLTLILLVFNISVKWTVFLVPLSVIALLLLGTMAGILFLPAGLLYKDVQSALLIVTSGLVFLTPVAYPPSVGGLLGKVMAINPLTPLITGTRDLFFRGIPANPVPILAIVIITIVLLFFGWLLYRLALPIIVERIGA
jgi:lipopolysaccharide transport system permease protein